MVEQLEFEPRPYVANEFRGIETNASGHFICPLCGEFICLISWEGVLEPMEMACKSCDTGLLGHSVVFIPDEYSQEHDDPSPDDLQKVVISYWESNLDDEQMATEYKYRAEQYGWDWEPEV